MSVTNPTWLAEHLSIVTQALYIAVVRFYVNCHEPEAPFGSLLMTRVPHLYCFYRLGLSLINPKTLIKQR